MNAFLNWLTAPEWALAVKALLHTLWQGAIIAIVVRLVLRRTTDPDARYRVSIFGLACVLVGGAVTWGVIPHKVPATVVGNNFPIATGDALEIEPVHRSGLPPVVVRVALQREEKAAQWTAWIALGWILGAAVMLGRAGVQIAGAEKLRRTTRPLTDPRIVEMLEQARRALRITREVRLAVTDRLTSPAVVGVIVPVLILPLTLVSALPPEQLRFILLHELAHVRRGDYFANLLQLFAEAVLFFNPAVWWLSAQVRREREACCDALATRLGGGPLGYAQTLVRVAEGLMQDAPEAAPAFSNGRETSSLADRVQRLLVPGYRPVLRLTWSALLLPLFACGVLLVLSAMGTQETRDSERETAIRETNLNHMENLNANKSGRETGRGAGGGDRASEAAWKDDNNWQKWSQLRGSSNRIFQYSRGSGPVTVPVSDPQFSLGEGLTVFSTESETNAGLRVHSLVKTPGFHFFQYSDTDVNDTLLLGKNLVSLAYDQVKPLNQQWVWYRLPPATPYLDQLLKPVAREAEETAGGSNVRKSPLGSGHMGITNELVTRVFKLNEEQMKEVLQEPANQSDGKTNSFYLFLCKAGLDITKNKDWTMHLGRLSRTLSVSASEKDLDLIETYLARFQPLPNIHIAAKLIEVPVEAMPGLMVLMSTNGNGSGTNVSTIVLTEARANNLFSRLEKEFGARLVASPAITTVSGREAQIEFSNREADIQTIESTTTNSQPQIVYRLNPPLSLLLLPQLEADGKTIRSSVMFSMKEFAGYDDSSGYFESSPVPAGGSVSIDRTIASASPNTGNGLSATYSTGSGSAKPRFRLREMQATATVWNGQTAVLTDVPQDDLLMTRNSQTQSKNNIPVLSDAPLPGKLFTQSGKTTRKCKLLIFITPTLVDAEGRRVHSGGDMLPTGKKP